MSNKWYGSPDNNSNRNLIKLVKYYYEKRQLKHPNIWEALGWATAELGEVYEVLMSMVGGWVRNNPDKHPQKTKQDLAEELGDVIFMLIVAGIEEGVDPIEAMTNKMRRKLEAVSGISEMKETTPEEFLEDTNGN